MTKLKKIALNNWSILYVLTVYIYYILIFIGNTVTTLLEYKKLTHNGNFILVKNETICAPRISDDIVWWEKSVHQHQTQKKFLSFVCSADLFIYFFCLLNSAIFYCEHTRVRLRMSYVWNWDTVNVSQAKKIKTLGGLVALGIFFFFQNPKDNSST